MYFIEDVTILAYVDTSFARNSQTASMGLILLHAIHVRLQRRDTSPRRALPLTRYRFIATAVTPTVPHFMLCDELLGHLILMIILRH